MNLRELTAAYNRHVDGYRLPNGELPAMMELKRIHTAHVVRNAELIADGERFDAVTREAVLAAALLHDTGRYEQLRRFNTFRDAESIDHAAFSHDIVKERGWLDSFGQTGDPAVRQAILDGILLHNRRELPEGMDALSMVVAHAVRDADKLDIFRVREEQVAHSDWRKGTREFWNLEAFAPPSPTVVDLVERGLPVDYGEIKVLADFVLIQVGWMVTGLHYPTSRRLCVERGHLASCRDFLRQLTDDPSVDRVCDFAERALKG